MNRFVDSRTFAWQSQNQQRQDNSAGRLVLDHRRNGHSLHLFVQVQSHEKAQYCGKVEVVSVEKNAPMNVLFRLEHELSASMCTELLDAPRPDPQVFSIPLEDGRAKGRAFETLLPLYSLRAAAGYFGAGEAVEAEGLVEAPNVGVLDKGMFVARAVGRSMEPTIHDGDLLVFRANPVGTRQGKIVLAQYRGPADPETGGSFTVKRYSSEKLLAEDGEWRHSRILLSPLNREFTPIVISADEADDFRIVAEFIAVLPAQPMT